MTFVQYQEEASRTTAPLSSIEKLINGVIGLAGETGEVSELVKKMLFHGQAVSATEIAEELGDVLWYIALTCEALRELGKQVHLEDIAIGNIEKLKRRYPDGFPHLDREGEVS